MVMSVMGHRVFGDSVDCMRDCNHSCGSGFLCNVKCEWKCIKSATLASYEPLKAKTLTPGSSPFPSPSPKRDGLGKMRKLLMN
ncbi:hypothetical protein V6N13_014625 [Hibiscus sabdariffa]